MAEDLFSAAEKAHAVALNPMRVQGELRIKDEDLGRRLGFARPADIRKLIGRHAENLRKISVLATVAQTPDAIKGGRPSVAYYLNRKQAIFVTAKSETAEATEITIEIIERFDAYERGQHPPAMVLPGTFAEALRLAADQAEKIEAQKAQLAVAQPKAEALDRIAGADGLTCIQDAAKMNGLAPNGLFPILRRWGWIFRRHGAGAYVPYETQVRAGRMELKVTTIRLKDGTEKVVEQALFTAKGLTDAASKLRAERKGRTGA